jgi:hypothetical protein
MAAAALLMLPSVAIALYGFSRARDGSTEVMTGHLAYKAKYRALAETLASLPDNLLCGWQNATVPLIMLVLGALWLTLLLSAREDDPRPSTGFAFRLELVLGLAVAASLFLPMHLMKPVDLWLIGWRFPSLVALIGALLPRGPIKGRRALLLVPVGVAAAIYPLLLSGHWARFSARTRPFVRVAQSIPRGASTLTLMLGDKTDPDVDARAVPWQEFHSYVQLLAGGFNPWSLQTGFPIVRRPEAALPAPKWDKPQTFNFHRHGEKYDYILTQREFWDYGAFESGAAVKLVVHDGDWRLYRVLKDEP